MQQPGGDGRDHARCSPGNLLEGEKAVPSQPPAASSSCRPWQPSVFPHPRLLTGNAVGFTLTNGCWPRLLIRKRHCWSKPGSARFSATTWMNSSWFEWLPSSPRWKQGWTSSAWMAALPCSNCWISASNSPLYYNNSNSTINIISSPHCGNTVWRFSTIQSSTVARRTGPPTTFSPLSLLYLPPWLWTRLIRFPLSAT